MACLGPMAVGASSQYVHCSAYTPAGAATSVVLLVDWVFGYLLIRRIRNRIYRSCIWAWAAGRSERGVGVGVEGIDAVLVEVGLAAALTQ